MIWYSHLFQNFPQFIVIHTVKDFGIVNKAEIDVFFLKLSCFFNDPADVGNLISGSAAYKQGSKFSQQIFVTFLTMRKSILKDKRRENKQGFIILSRTWKYRFIWRLLGPDSSHISINWNHPCIWHYIGRMWRIKQCTEKSRKSGEQNYSLLTQFWGYITH